MGAVVVPSGEGVVMSGEVGGVVPVATKPTRGDVGSPVGCVAFATITTTRVVRDQMGQPAELLGALGVNMGGVGLGVCSGEVVMGVGLGVGLGVDSGAVGLI